MMIKKSLRFCFKVRIGFVVIWLAFIFSTIINSSLHSQSFMNKAKVI